MSEKKFPGCFKFGCIGCLALFALAVGLLVLIGVMQATMEDQEPDPEERETSHTLPPAPARPMQPDQVEMPEISPLPPGVEAPPAAAAGTVVLDLRMGEFSIRPGPPGEPIRVEADYDANAFDLKETFTENEDGTWTYDVSFGAKGGWLGLLFRGGNNNRNRVDVIIPRGHPVSIVGKIGMGESEIDLGGLWVENVDLETSAGDHFLEFREPLPVPMGDFKLDGSMGNLEVNGLGDASPRTVAIDHGMGELIVDLGGAWRRDATVDVGFSMGECRLRLPSTARVEISRASVGMGDKHVDDLDESELPADAPLLTLNVSGSMGGLRIEN